MFLKGLLYLQILVQVFVLSQDDVQKIYQRYIRDILRSEEDADYEIISPVRVDRFGKLLHRSYRDTNISPEKFYEVEAFGEKIQLRLRLSESVDADDITFNIRNGDTVVPLEKRAMTENCFYIGEVTSHSNSPVALSSCSDGLTGLITTPEADYFIRPVAQHNKDYDNLNSDHHAVFRKKKSNSLRCKRDTSGYLMKEKKSKTPHPNSAYFTPNLTIEMAIILDDEMKKYYDHVFPQNTYDETLTFHKRTLDIVQYIYNNGGLGKKFKFVLVHFEIWEQNPTDVSVGNGEAAPYLRAFGKWMKANNVQNDDDPKHYDYAFFYTGHDIKFGKGAKQDPVLGLSQQKAICTKQSSNSINNGIGSSIMYTAAHELGHCFDMVHDGQENACPKGKTIMGAEDGVYPFSSCSKNEFMETLKLPTTACLKDDRKAETKFDHEIYNGQWLGETIDMEKQCTMLHGDEYKPPTYMPKEIFCDNLYCQNKQREYSKIPARPALEGSECKNVNGVIYWCRNKRCVPKPRRK